MPDLLNMALNYGFNLLITNNNGLFLSKIKCAEPQ